MILPARKAALLTIQVGAHRLKIDPVTSTMEQTPAGSRSSNSDDQQKLSCSQSLEILNWQLELLEEDDAAPESDQEVDEQVNEAGLIGRKNR